MRSRTGKVLGRAILAAGALLAMTLPARAEHFDIYLKLKSTSGGIAESGWDTDPPEGGLHERQVLTLKAGEDLSLEWRIRSEFPHGIMRKAIVRLFVAPESTLGQKQMPQPSDGRVIDNSFTADFLPQHMGRGETHFRVAKPGLYLLRLQSENTLKEHGHEHFAAIDLKVE